MATNQVDWPTGIYISAGGTYTPTCSAGRENSRASAVEEREREGQTKRKENDDEMRYNEGLHTAAALSARERVKETDGLIIFYISRGARSERAREIYDDEQMNMTEFRSSGGLLENLAPN